MTDTQIFEIVSRWYGQGHITQSERELLKAEYLKTLDEKPSCTTCALFYTQLLTYYWSYFKHQGTPLASARKWMVAKDSFVQLPGDSMIYINEGVEDESRTILTDEIAEEILRRFPTYDKMIVLNPAYQNEVDTALSAVVDDKSQESGAGEQKVDSQNAHQDGDNDDDDDDDEQSGALTALQTKFDALQTSYDALNAEHAKTKDELRVAKGQLTKAVNKLSTLQPAGSTVPDSAVTNPAVPVDGTAPASTTVPADAPVDPAKAADQNSPTDSTTQAPPVDNRPPAASEVNA